MRHNAILYTDANFTIKVIFTCSKAWVELKNAYRNEIHSLDIFHWSSGGPWQKELKISKCVRSLTWVLSIACEYVCAARSCGLTNDLFALHNSTCLVKFKPSGYNRYS